MRRLDAWLRTEGKGASARLHRTSGVSLPAIARARLGCASLATAIKIHLATGGKVPVADMTREEREVVRHAAGARGRR